MATTCPSSWVYQNSRWGEEGEKGQPYLSTPQGEGKDRRERSSPFMPVSTSHVTSRFQNSKLMNIYKECIRIIWKIDWFPVYSSVQSLSHVRLFANPWNRSTPGLPVHHQLPEFTQTHVRRVGDAIQPSHPLSSPSPPAPQSLPASGSFLMSQLFTSL